MLNDPTADDFDGLLSTPSYESDRPVSTKADNAAVAVDLAAQGFAVFPVRDWQDGDGPKPIKGFQTRASTDTQTVAQWWRTWPDANVGMLAGERNGFSVLDVDMKGGKDGVATLADLGFPDIAALSSFRVQTPNGGWHLYFRHDPRLKNSVSEIGPGLDVRTSGGLVMAPGSFKGGACYRVVTGPLDIDTLPSFPDALIPAVQPERDVVAPVSEASEAQCKWAKDHLRTKADKLAAMEPDSGRNSALNAVAMWAGGAAAHGFLTRDHAEDVLWTAADACGIRRRAFGATFNSGWKAGLRNPISEFPKEQTADDYDDVEDLPEKQSPDDTKPPRLRFLSPGECADAPLRGYVIKGFAAPGDVGCIYGAPGAGKSLISPHLGYAVAQGRSAFTMRTRQGRVFYVAAEDPHGMRGRVSALKLRHGDAGNFTLVEGVSDLLTKDSADFAALRRAVKEQKPSLIFIDTLAMAFPGLEENSADAMGRVVAIARKLASYGAAVFLIHHDTKAGTPTPRGHSLLNGALDVALQLFARDEQGIVRGKLSKNRNGACDRDIAFRIATESMGIDEDGDAITCALVDELASGAAKARPKLTASERAALKILTDMVKMSAGHSVAEDDWRAACIEARTVSASDDRESRRKATKRAFEGLARKSAVFLKDRTVLLPDIFGNLSWADGDGFDDFEEAAGA